LAEQAVKTGGTAMAMLNAANEIAVEAFLQERIRFTDISVIIEQALEKGDIVEPVSLEVVKQADQQARRFAEQAIESLAIA
jgi:1-deoxy-D-xylulose-5-phosphate reductoisomerase